jgi:glycosyl transferase family 25
MEAILPPELAVTFTSDWPGPFDGHELDRSVIEAAGYRLFPWRVDSDNPWWSRPLKLGEVGCTIAHWTCWRHAYETGSEPYVLVLEDDVVLASDFVTSLLTCIESLDSQGFDLLYLGRYPLEADKSVIRGVVSPGYSHCTFGYVLTRRALPTLLRTRLDQAVVPVDEFLPSLYVDHPRADLRARFPKQLVALAFEPPLVRQLPKAIAGSDTEDSAFVDW